MARRDVIVVGASAGGVEALIQLTGGLPPDLDAAVFVVLHMPVDARSVLPRILDRAGPLVASHATDGQLPEPGHIYVAPPNHHLLLEHGYMRLTVGPRVNGVRPAIDALFQSAARAYGPRVVGVVLSGTLYDGTLGLDAIKLRGGVAVVQDPGTAERREMPDAAVAATVADAILPLEQIGPFLYGLCCAVPKDEAAPAREAEAARSAS